MSGRETTTLTISRELRNRIAKLGEKDDTFEDILEMLVKSYKSKKGKV